MAFVRNAWYVAGWASEFGDGLTPMRILGEDLVIYRTSNGDVAALQDRCPHKLLPLSMGRIIDDQVQCGYHGTTFGSDGKCTRVPGQINVPKTACVRAYPTHQRHDIVWVWMGDADKADPAAIFDLPQMSDPGWYAHQGDALQIKSNYMNVADNLVDPAHVAYVHPTTLGNASHEAVPVDFDVDSDPIAARRWIRDAPPVDFFKEFGAFTSNVDRWQHYYLHLPCTAVIDFGCADVDQALGDDDRHQGIQFFALHFMTPVTAGNTIDRWMHLRRTDVGNADVSHRMDDLFRVAFQEDKTILEAIQAEENKDADGEPLRLAIDKGSFVYRKRVAELIAAEASAA